MSNNRRIRGGDHHARSILLLGATAPMGDTFANAEYVRGISVLGFRVFRPNYTPATKVPVW